MTRPSQRPVKGKKAVRALKTVRTHVMLNGGQTDHNNTPICEYCGHLSTHRIHDYNVPEGTAEVSARILGEGSADPETD